MKLTWSVLALALLGMAAAPGGTTTSIGPAPIPTLLAGDAKVETWPMTIHAAIRIGLGNSEIFFARFTYLEAPPRCFDVSEREPMPGPTLIRAVKADTSPSQVRTDAMALVRSVEQQYWALAARRVRVWCTEQAIGTCRDIVNKYEQAELPSRGRGTVSDIAEATARLEQLQQDLKSQTELLADEERRLRVVLGLPQSDNRRIVPTTRPIEEPLSFDRESCLHEMLRWQADRVEKSRAKEERNDRNPSIHALAECYSGAETSYKQYGQAGRLRTAAVRRLEAQRTAQEAGRITIDRYLEAINEHADAMAIEFQYAATYNTSLAALGEIKGTLLADRYILVIEQTLRMPKNWLVGYGQKDDQATTASFTSEPKPTAEKPSAAKP
jgi:hypothetical protein